MMNDVDFDKALMKRFTAALRDGRPIEPSLIGWTEKELLHAGAAILNAITDRLMTEQERAQVEKLANQAERQPRWPHPSFSGNN